MKRNGGGSIELSCLDGSGLSDASDSKTCFMMGVGFVPEFVESGHLTNRNGKKSSGWSFSFEASLASLEALWFGGGRHDRERELSVEMTSLMLPSPEHLVNDQEERPEPVILAPATTPPKVLENSSRMKKNKQQNDTRSKIVVKVSANGHISSNQLHAEPKPEGIKNPGIEALSEKLNKLDLLQLKKQIEELMKRVFEKQCILHPLYQSPNDVQVHKGDYLKLQAKVDELQKALRAKDYIIRLMQSQLFEAQDKFVSLGSHLEGVETEVLKKDKQIFVLKQELDELRSLLAILRYQLQSVDFGMDNQTIPSVSWNLPQNDIKKEEPCILKELQKRDMERLEAARCMYLAAITTAKSRPGEESSALAAEFRKQLQSLLLQSTR